MQIYKLLTLVAQELLVLPEHMSSPSVFSEVCEHYLLIDTAVDDDKWSIFVTALEL
jgi:hypothetical protein